MLQKHREMLKIKEKRKVVLYRPFAADTTHEGQVLKFTYPDSFFHYRIFGLDIAKDLPLVRYE